MLFSSCATLCFHIPLCWALVSKLKLGSIGATVFTDSSYWLNVFLLRIHSPNKRQYLITCIYADLLSQQVSPTHLWYPHIMRRHSVDSHNKIQTPLIKKEREHFYMNHVCNCMNNNKNIIFFYFTLKHNGLTILLKKALKVKRFNLKARNKVYFIK